MRNLFLGALIGIASTALMAQRGTPAVPDAVTADPDHYSVSFENELVRLIPETEEGSPATPSDWRAPIREQLEKAPEEQAFTPRPPTI